MYIWRPRTLRFSTISAACGQLSAGGWHVLGVRATYTTHSTSYGECCAATKSSSVLLGSLGILSFVSQRNITTTDSIPASVSGYWVL